MLCAKKKGVLVFIYYPIMYKQDYFSSHSMNQTVRIVRDKLDKVMHPTS